MTPLVPTHPPPTHNEAMLSDSNEEHPCSMPSPGIPERHLNADNEVWCVQFLKKYTTSFLGVGREMMDTHRHVQDSARHAASNYLTLCRKATQGDTVA